MMRQHPANHRQRNKPAANPLRTDEVRPIAAGRERPLLAKMINWALQTL